MSIENMMINYQILGYRVYFRTDRQTQIIRFFLQENDADLDSVCNEQIHVYIYIHESRMVVSQSCGPRGQKASTLSHASIKTWILPTRIWEFRQLRIQLRQFLVDLRNNHANLSNQNGLSGVKEVSLTTSRF